ncbi:MAG: pyridoxamine 5'-phosphate oxidase family protein [Rhodocyclaceae bacterium]|nr:pyridoxamine 5'-phosphate oxidase family protein [Rhodocyclaceae bacterium]MDZ4216460.1 pyridoxamine 5'-phosphate oxidase family protein [Rhodocyclaceae bacterium]
MLSRLELLIDLLHSIPEAALATHSTTLDGFPFASAVPFVADAHHRPIMLISALAEHSRNLLACPRASLMIAKTLGEGEMARVSLIGEVHPIEAAPHLVARYLRYHPHAKRFLQLGDFRFHRFDPIRVLTVGGFAKASWLEGSRLLEAPVISLNDEADLLAQYAQQGRLDCLLRGIDAFGADALLDDKPVRIRFSTGPVTKEAWLPTLHRALTAMTRTTIQAKPDAAR